MSVNTALEISILEINKILHHVSRNVRRKRKRKCNPCRAGSTGQGKHDGRQRVNSTYTPDTSNPQQDFGVQTVNDAHFL